MPDRSLGQVTKNDNVMKPSLLDDLETQNINSAEIVGENGIIMDGWKNQPSEIIGYNKIKELIDTKIPKPLKEEAFNILKNIFYFDSQVEVIYKADNKHFLLRLSEPKIIIDLFNKTTEDFFGKHYQNKKDYLEDRFLGAIDSHGYNLFCIRETSELLNKKETNQVVISHKGEINYDKKSKGINLWREELTRLFHGNHNWDSNPSYTFNNMCLFPYQVFCYEIHSYIREDNDYIVENNQSFDNDYIEKLPETQVAIFTCDNQDSTDVKLLFKGLYELDKTRSKQEGYIAFRFINDQLNI